MKKEEYETIFDMARRCGITKSELDECIMKLKYYADRPIINVKHAARDLRRIMNKLKN